MPSARVAQYVQAAEIIVVGEVVSLHLDMEDVFVRAEDLAQNNTTIGQRHPVRATIEVHRYLVGGGPTQLRVASGACNAFDFAEVGDTVVLFLVQDSGWLVTSLCQGSGRADVGASSDEVEALTGPGNSPAYRGLRPDLADTDFPLIPAATLAVVGPLAFLAGAAFLLRPSRASG